MSGVSLVGLDGAPWSRLDPWIEAGELPNIARLVETGVHGTLYSTIPSRTSPAIPALYTGCDPSELGFTGFTKPDGSTITIKDIDVPTIWDALDRADVRSCVANVRTTYPPPLINGVMIAGDPAPGEDSEYYHPPEIADTVAGFRMESADRRRHDDLVPADEHADEVLKLSKRILNERFERFESLATADEYLFQMFWIGGTDFLQHRLWSHEERLLEFYREADRVIGQLQAATDGNTIVLSDHGFHPPSEWRFHLNEWLYDKGFLRIHGGAVGKRLLRTGQHLARTYVSPGLLVKALSVLSRTGTDEGTEPPWFDRRYESVPGISGESRAYLSASTGITVTGSGESYDRTVESIVQGLKETRTPDGRPVVNGVWRRDDAYEAGRYRDELPDVAFVAAEGISIEPQLSGRLFARSNEARAGHQHAREGLWCAAGPDIGSGDIDANIIDIAPTVLTLLGVPPGRHMQGSVIAEALTDSLSVPDRIDYRRLASRAALSDDEEAEMAEWLADMGYR